MKNLVLALLLICGLVNLSNAGDCGNGVCTASVQPVRKVVNITRNVVAVPFRAVVAVTTPVSNSCCETVVSSTNACGCSSTTKEVVKYQPLRRRLVNRSTTIGCCQ